MIPDRPSHLALLVEVNPLIVIVCGCQGIPITIRTVRAPMICPACGAGYQVTRIEYHRDLTQPPENQQPLPDIDIARIEPAIIRPN